MNAKANGDFPGAQQAFETVIALSPVSPDDYINFGVILRSLGQIDEAISSYQTAPKFAPENGTLWTNLANAFGDQNNFDEVNAAYREALSLNPENGDAAWGLHELFEKRNHVSDLAPVRDENSSFAPTAQMAHAHFTALLYFRNTQFSESDRAAQQVSIGKFNADQRTVHL